MDKVASTGKLLYDGSEFTDKPLNKYTLYTIEYLPQDLATKHDGDCCAPQHGTFRPSVNRFHGRIPKNSCVMNGYQLKCRLNL